MIVVFWCSVLAAIVSSCLLVWTTWKAYKSHVRQKRLWRAMWMLEKMKTTPLSDEEIDELAGLMAGEGFYPDGKRHEAR